MRMHLHMHSTCTHYAHLRAVTVSVHLFRREQGPLVEVQVDSDSVACDSSVRALLSGWGRRPRPSPFDPPLAPRPSPRPSPKPSPGGPRGAPRPCGAISPRLAARTLPRLLRATRRDARRPNPCSNPAPQPEAQTYRNPTLPGPIPNHVGKKLDHLHRRRQPTTNRRGIRFPRTAQGAYNTGY